MQFPDTPPTRYTEMRMRVWREANPGYETAAHNCEYERIYEEACARYAENPDSLVESGVDLLATPEDLKQLFNVRVRRVRPAKTLPRGPRHTPPKRKKRRHR